VKWKKFVSMVVIVFLVFSLSLVGCTSGSPESSEGGKGGGEKTVSCEIGPELTEKGDLQVGDLKVADVLSSLVLDKDMRAFLDVVFGAASDGRVKKMVFDATQAPFYQFSMEISGAYVSPDTMKAVFDGLKKLAPADKINYNPSDYRITIARSDDYNMAFDMAYYLSPADTLSVYVAKRMGNTSISKMGINLGKLDGTFFKVMSSMLSTSGIDITRPQSGSHNEMLLIQSNRQGSIFLTYRIETDEESGKAIVTCIKKIVGGEMTSDGNMQTLSSKYRGINVTLSSESGEGGVYFILLTLQKD